MGKKAIIWTIVIVVLLIIVGIFFSLTSSATTPSLLYVEKGEVLVDKGSGYVAAADEMELNENWKIKTGENSEASIVFYESDIIMLEPNTELIVSEIKPDRIKTETTTGETTHTVGKITGTRSYEAKTPTAVATVRGTIFTLSPENDEALLYEGILDLKVGEENLKLDQNKKSMLSKAEVIDMNDEDKQRFQNKKLRLMHKYKKLRLREMNKKPFVVGTIKKMYKMDDEKINKWLQEADEGKRDLNDAERRIPFKIKSVNKVRRMTERIRDINKI